MTPSLPRKPYISRLNTIGAVRRELARLYKQARTGSIQTNDASKLAHILWIVARILEGSEVEARLTRLEQLLMEKEQA